MLYPNEFARLLKTIQPLPAGEILGAPDMVHPVTAVFSIAVLQELLSQYRQEIELHHGVATDETIPEATREFHASSEDIARARWNALAFAINLIETSEN